MKKSARKLTCLLISATTLTFAAGMASASPAVPKLAGTWEIVGTPDPGGCGPTSPFTGLTTITPDGSLTNVDPDPAVSTTVGQAYKLGKHMYAIGFFGYLNPAPGITLRIEVQSTLTDSSPGETAGRFRSIVTDPNGIIPECVYEGTISGTRLVPMPY
jgi:hypothetical protein